MKKHKASEIVKEYNKLVNEINWDDDMRDPEMELVPSDKVRHSWQTWTGNEHGYQERYIYISAEEAQKHLNELKKDVKKYGAK